jgi:hypothetical protein
LNREDPMLWFLAPFEDGDAFFSQRHGVAG